MRTTFTEEQIIAALREHAAGTPAKELCRWLGVGVETLYRWKHKYGGLEVSEARRLRALLFDSEAGGEGTVWVAFFF